MMLRHADGTPYMAVQDYFGAGEIRIVLVGAETLILDEIADSRMKREDIAQTYAFVIRQLPANDPRWREINHAILDRWSMAALKWIKERAWKLLREASNQENKP